MLTGRNIFLRKLQVFDTRTILKWENNPTNWSISGTKKPFSEEEIIAFTAGEQNLIKNNQLRYIICLNTSKDSIGTIDLFEYDKGSKKVGIGVLIAESKERRKGFAIEALILLINYCKNELQLNTIFCNIDKENIASIRLFEKCNFSFIEEQLLFENKVNYYELVL